MSNDELLVTLVVQSDSACEAARGLVQQNEQAGSVTHAVARPQLELIRHRLTQALCAVEELNNRARGVKLARIGD